MPFILVWLPNFVNSMPQVSLELTQHLTDIASVGTFTDSCLDDLASSSHTKWPIFRPGQIHSSKISMIQLFLCPSLFPHCLEDEDPVGKVFADMTTAQLSFLWSHHFFQKFFVLCSPHKVFELFCSFPSTGDALYLFPSLANFHVSFCSHCPSATLCLAHHMSDCPLGHWSQRPNCWRLEET